MKKKQLHHFYSKSSSTLSISREKCQDNKRKIQILISPNAAQSFAKKMLISMILEGTNQLNHFPS